MFSNHFFAQISHIEKNPEVSTLLSNFHETNDELSPPNYIFHYTIQQFHYTELYLLIMIIYSLIQHRHLVFTLHIKKRDICNTKSQAIYD